MIGIDEKLNEDINLQLEFTDREGNPVKLGDYFDGKPVVINLMYLSCPRVCTFALDGVLEVVNETRGLYIGTDYRVLSISFNPEEDHVIAKKGPQIHGKHFRTPKRPRTTVGNF